jgi:hypothetical protein
MESSGLSFPKLHGKKNWTSWKFLITNRLRSQGCLTVVDGTSKRPEPPAHPKEWDGLNAKAVELIGCTLDAHSEKSL